MIRESLRALSMIFATTINMAQSHVFPLLLDGAQVNISASTHTWAGTSSILRVDSTSTITVGSGSVTGTLLNIISRTADDVLVRISPDPYGSNNLDQITLTNSGDHCTLMWTGSAWIILSSVVGAAAID